MATLAQRSSSASPSMLFMRWSSSLSTKSYPPLFVASTNILIIGGDINAQIGKNEHNKFCLHNSSNKQISHLKKRQHALILNSRKRRENYGLTLTQIILKQIDYILINKKWINSTLNCEAYSSFEGVSSNHRFVIEKIRLSIYAGIGRKRPKPHTMTVPCFTIEILVINIQ